MSEFTVFGASGFIGSHLVKRLRAMDHAVFAPGRGEDVSGMSLGAAIYCVGLTADFRTRPLDTVEAHVCHLLHLLRSCKFDSLLYLSTTRLYKPDKPVGQEEDDLYVNPHDPGDLYNISKLMGESVLLSSGRNVRLARISNVYGDDFASSNFLSSVVRDAVNKGTVTLQTSLDSAKDYISIEDVVETLIRIAGQGQHRMYNVASGFNVSNRELMAALQSAVPCMVQVVPDAPVIVFPRVSVMRIVDEFSFEPVRLLQNIRPLISSYTAQPKNVNC